MLTGDHVHDPKLALEFARRAEQLSGGTTPNVLDTLALAQHQTEDTAGAIKTQKKAIELLPENSQKRADYLETLRNYERSRDSGR